MEADLGFDIDTSAAYLDSHYDRHEYMVCLQLYSKVFDNLRFERIYMSPCCDYIRRLNA